MSSDAERRPSEELHSFKAWLGIDTGADLPSVVDRPGFEGDLPTPVDTGSWLLTARNCARNVVSRRRLQAPSEEGHTATTAKWGLRRGSGTGIIGPGRNGGR